MICRKCGSDIPDNSTVCAVCASPVIKRAPVVQSAAQRPAMQRPASAQPAAQTDAASRPLEFRPAPTQPVAQRPAQPAAQRLAMQRPAQPSAQRPSASRPVAPPPMGFRPAPARPAAQRPAPARPEANKPAAQRSEQSRPAAAKPAAKRTKKSRPSAAKPAAKLSKLIRSVVAKIKANIQNALTADKAEKKKALTKIGGIGAAVLLVLIVIFSSVGSFFGKLELYDTLSSCEWECETEKTSGYFGYSYNDTEEIRFNYPEFGFKGTAAFDESRYEYKIKSSKKVVIDGVKYKVKFNDVDNDGVHDEMIFEATGKDKENAKFAKIWKCTSEYHSNFKLVEDTWGFIVKGWQNLLK